LCPAWSRTSLNIERTIEAFARTPNGGLLLPPDSTNNIHRDLIIALAAQYSLPTVSFLRAFVAAGGLMSYGVDYVDMNRQAAAYVDRILRGDNPADLPVQAATKFETIVNLKTAKALGIRFLLGRLRSFYLDVALRPCSVCNPWPSPKRKAHHLASVGS
jgi:putative tryptophan/tyrosine transport system substrate-binding protein